MVYCPALYCMNQLRPDLWEMWSVKFERYRSLITFLTPRKIKWVEEILLYNSGLEKDHIVYDLVQFKQQLYIFDSDDKKLEFHSFSSNQKNASKYLIKIEFPKDKPLKTGDYRTISLHYCIEVSSSSRYIGLISVPLDLADSFFIHIEKPKEYQINLNFFQRPYGIIEIVGNHFNDLYLEETDMKVQIRGKNTINYKELFVTFRPDLHQDTKAWFDLGAYLGLLSAVLISFELFTAPRDFDTFSKFIPLIIPLAVSMIASLIVIKGWIFTKDMDWILKDINNTKKSMLTYDQIYIRLIMILALEIAITVIILIGTVNW